MRKLGLRNPDPAFRQRAFEKILEASQRASAISGGVLGVARPRADRREPTDLVRLTQEVTLLVGKDLSRHRVHLDFKAVGRPYARVNPAQIQQVLLNLMINARQAMPERARFASGLARTPRAGSLSWSVADTGVGIARPTSGGSLNPSSTKTGPDASGQEGTGLALSVCRDIVESHHGRLRAESPARPGDQLPTLRLPVCPAPTERGC